MKRKKILNDNYLLRRDIGNLLFHWTKRADGKTAKEILKKIISDEELLGNNKFIKGGHKCVCFTETPIAEIASLFKLYQSLKEDERIKFEPYGIAVHKQWLFSQGGRPVIYQPDKDYELLADEIKWKHVRFDNNGSDFTWEREWRIKKDSLKLNPKHMFVIVPKADDAFEIMYNNADLEYDNPDFEGVPQTENHIPYWMAVSLDLFGINFE